MKLESPETDKVRRISIDLPNKLIDRFDYLKKEWGLRARGAVIERLLEIVLSDESDSENTNIVNENTEVNDLKTTNSQDYSNSYNENTALVLIGDTDRLSLEKNYLENSAESLNKSRKDTKTQSKIDLPGFVRKRSEQLKTSLNKKSPSIKDEDPFLICVHKKDIENALSAANKHWLSLYGQPPKDTVIEAAMTWLAFDIWSQIEGTENTPFTWTAANKLMAKYSPTWESKTPNFERVIVIAGVLEDPFGTLTLPERMPSLIRRFVNKFKKSQKVTSFQTLESTMTVHGALKLLDLPTKAGSSLTLIKVRDSYKQKALSVHPDAGGSTESMRRLNEAYQLLKELYREKNK